MQMSKRYVMLHILKGLHHVPYVKRFTYILDFFFTSVFLQNCQLSLNSESVDLIDIHGHQFCRICNVKLNIYNQKDIYQLYNYIYKQLYTSEDFCHLLNEQFIQWLDIKVKIHKNKNSNVNCMTKLLKQQPKYFIILSFNKFFFSIGNARQHE